MNGTAVVLRAPKGEMEVLAEAMRKGVETGTVQTAVERAWVRIHEVEEENRRLKRKNALLRDRVRLLERDRRYGRRERVEAYERAFSRQAEWQRARDWRVSRRVTLIAAGMMATMLMTCWVVLR